jgi:arylformamidase
MKAAHPALVLLLSTAAFAAEPRIQRNIPYAEPANERQSLDVYAPATGENHPVVVWMHGGGWQRGSKNDVAAKPEAFVKQGCVFIPINYRFIPVVKMEVIASDVAKAVRWARDHAREFGGDPDTIFMMGHSAGAQLAALVCTDERYLQAEGLALKNVKGCVPVDADTFYPALQIETSPPTRAASYRLKFPAGKDQELSSVVHVAKDKGIPPFLILHIAGRPESGTKIQAEILAKSLTEAGVPVQVYAGEGKTHATLDTDLGLPADRPTQVLFEFVAALAGKSGAKHLNH